MKKIFLIGLIVLGCFQLHAQTKYRYNDEYKNSVKGMIYPGFLFYSFFNGYLGTATIGYERKLKKDFTLGVLGSWSWTETGEYTSARIYSVAPELRYYFPKNKNKMPAIWVGAYIPFVYSDGSDYIDRYYYGVGLMTGAKIFLSEKHKWYVDLGGGFSVNKSIWINTFECYKGKGFPVWLPKVFFHLGHRF